MKWSLLFFILGLFSLSSCERILDNYWEREAEENYVSSFKGIWKGNYSGNEIGGLNLEVAKNGYISIIRTTQFSTETTSLSGMVRDDGALQSVIMESGFTLYGNLLTKSGTWKKGEISGTWELTKQ